MANIKTMVDNQEIMQYILKSQSQHFAGIYFDIHGGKDLYNMFFSVFSGTISN